MKRDPNHRNTPPRPIIGRIPAGATEHTFVLASCRMEASPDGRTAVAHFHTHVFTCLIADDACLPYRRDTK